MTGTGMAGTEMTGTARTRAVRTRTAGTGMAGTRMAGTAGAGATGATGATASTAHPMLKPALRRGWRSRDTVQFGVARAHAVVLGPVDTATGSFLELLDGTRGLPLLRQEARALGLPEGRA